MEIARDRRAKGSLLGLKWLVGFALMSFVYAEAGAAADFRRVAYPIVYDGDAVTAPVAVNDWTNFEPLSGRYRNAVNPGAPVRLDERTLRFDLPGEYYLLLNGAQPWRVLVLAHDEPVSDSVVRLFDFLVANLATTQGQDLLYSGNPVAYMNGFFQSRDPGLLLCGPTLSMFQQLIKERFDLPVREVTYSGTTMSGGQVVYATHNVVEVYLPDKSKWVQFDVNSDFLVKWLGALELAAKVRAKAGSARRLLADEWSTIDWSQHIGVDPRLAIDAANSEPKFRPDLIGKSRASENWHLLSSIMVGGPSYWGGPRFEQPGLPKDYDVYYATTHDDPFLVEASVRWVANWQMSVKVMSRAEMEALLAASYAPVIQAEAWLARIHPAQRKLLESAR